MLGFWVGVDGLDGGWVVVGMRDGGGRKEGRWTVDGNVKIIWMWRMWKWSEWMMREREEGRFEYL